VLKPGAIAVTSIDDAFLKKVMHVVERAAGNEAFSVEILPGRQYEPLAASQKAHGIDGPVTERFYPVYAPASSMELLRKNAGTVSEISVYVVSAVYPTSRRASRSSLAHCPVK